MSVFNKIDRHGYSIKFSPFDSNRLAVASSENFGIEGTGTLFILDIKPNGSIQEINSRHWPHGLYDVAWSAICLNHILTASAEGSLQLWDLDAQATPLHTFSGHYNEVSSIDWSYGDVILSASWDTSIKLWDLNKSTCLITFLGSLGKVNEVTLSSQIPNLLASASEEGNIRLWNIFSPNPVASFRTHDTEVLSCDWCKHNANLLATCGSDSLIRGWDIRNYRQPIFQLKGGRQAVKQIRFSPHYLNILASGSFDCTTKIWDFRHSEPLEVFEHHSDFVYGLDWNSQRIAEMADCSWDHTIRVFTSHTLRNLRNKL